MKQTKRIKKAKGVLTCGLMATMVLAGSSLSALAAENPGNLNSPAEPGVFACQQVETIAQPRDESMADFIASLSMLNQSEKAQLLQAENEKEPYYAQMNALYDQIEEKTADIMKRADSIFEQIFAIRNAHGDLWEKVDAQENEMQKAVGDDYLAFIQLSSAVTKAEKEVLLRDQMRIDALYKKVDAYYAQAAEATADLQTHLDAVRATIRDIDSRTDGIWDKVYAD